MVEEEFALSDGQNIRVGFVLFPLLGLHNNLRNLFAAIRSLQGNPLTPVLFMGKRQRDVSADFSGIEIVRASILDHKSVAWVIRKIIAKVTRRDYLLERLLRRHSIKVLSHVSFLGRQTAAKTIGWIADFQHVHLPEYFTREEILVRDNQFRDVCVNSDRVIVSSECARADLCTIFPEYAHKAELLRFVAGPDLLVQASILEELQKLYGFDGPYFLLPNQFWPHKNHRIVLDALRLLKSRNQPYLVLVTGSTKGHTSPLYFTELMQYADECNVLDCFRVLGVIPYAHLIGLMENAVAIINPSRFEGWSTSVEEAKSIGKQIVLSDIPVHLEQAPERSFYFSANDPLALADAMVDASSHFEKYNDEASQKLARIRYPDRIREFGDTYLQIVRNVVLEMEC